MTMINILDYPLPKPPKQTPKEEISGKAREAIKRTWLEAGQTRDFKKFASFCKTYSEFKGIKKDIYLSYDIWTEPQKMFEQNRSGRDIVLKPRRVVITA